MIKVFSELTEFITTHFPVCELEPSKAFERLVTHDLASHVRLYSVKVRDDDVIVTMGYSACGSHRNVTYRGPREEMERLLVAIRFYIDCDDDFDVRNNVEAATKIRRLTAHVDVPRLDFGFAFRAEKALIMFLGDAAAPHLKKLERLNVFQLFKVVGKVAKGRSLDAIVAKL